MRNVTTGKSRRHSGRQHPGHASIAVFVETDGHLGKPLARYLTASVMLLPPKVYCDRGAFSTTARRELSVVPGSH